jgi:hypothetical protein
LYGGLFFAETQDAEAQKKFENSRKKCLTFAFAGAILAKRLGEPGAGILSTEQN